MIFLSKAFWESAMTNRFKNDAVELFSNAHDSVVDGFHELRFLCQVRLDAFPIELRDEIEEILQVINSARDRMWQVWKDMPEELMELQVAA
jgi:uncharacterized protein Yka (UPF0111/DUF47 family)